MEYYTKVTKEILLYLSEKEAEWIKAYVQNPMTDNEREEDSEMRKEIFETISKALTDNGE